MEVLYLFDKFSRFQSALCVDCGAVLQDEEIMICRPCLRIANKVQEPDDQQANLFGKS